MDAAVIGTRKYNKKSNMLNWSQRCLLQLFDFLWGNLILVENEKVLETLDSPVIYALNHNCSYEVFLVATYLMKKRKGEKISFLVDWMYGRLPLLGWIFNQIDPIYVFNKLSKYDYLNRYRAQKILDRKPVHEKCIDYLNFNKSIAIFPEGTRNTNPQVLKRGKLGIGLIALETNVPILPIGIDFPSRHKKNRIPKFGPIILRCGQLMNFSNESALATRIKQNLKIEPRIQKKAITYLGSSITFKIMSQLSNLSGKKYPFDSPVLQEEEIAAFYYLDKRNTTEVLAKFGISEKKV